MNEMEMNWWMCSECEYIFQSKASPETCPNCHKECSFVDVTCYIPECGGPNNLDARLVAAKSAEDRKTSK